MMYLGDFAAGSIIHFKWSTNAADGSAITRSTNGTVSVYYDDNTTQTTTGITDTEDFDSVTGVHHCKIDTSADGTFYAAGREFQVVLSGATIDGKSVAAPLAHFSIGRASNAVVMLTNATYGLSAIKVLVDDLETRLTATRAGYLDNLSGGAVATAAALDTVDNFIDTEVAAIKAKTDNLPASPAATGDIPSAATIAAAVWDSLTSALSTASSIGKLLVDNINATISSRLASASYTAPLDAAGTRTALGLASANLDTQLDALPTNSELNARTLVAADYATAAALDTVDNFIDTEVAAIKAKTDNLPASPAATGDIPSAATIAAAVWDYLTSAATTVGSLGKLLVDRIDAAISSRSTLTQAQVNTEADQALADAGVTTTVTGRIDAAISSRLASASYTAPLDAAGTRTALGLASANLDTQLGDLPTNAELATALAGADDAVLAAIAALDIQAEAEAALAAYDAATGADVSAVSPPPASAVADAVWDEALAGHAAAGSAGEALGAAGTAGDPWTTSVPGAYGAGTAGYILGNRIDAAVTSRLAAASYTAPLDAAAIRAALGLAAANLDTQLDALPTNSELATALAAADDAVLAAIAALNNLSAAQVNAEVDTALADYDAPTKAEMDAALAAADDAVLAAIAALNNLSSAGAQSAAAAALAAYDPPTYAELTAALSVLATASVVAAIKAKTDGLNFTGTDVKATLDGEKVQVSGVDADALSSAALSTAAANEIATQVWASGTRTLTASPLSAADVWGHNNRTLTTAPPSATQVAAAVWSALRADHSSSGSFGEAVGELAQTSGGVGSVEVIYNVTEDGTGDPIAGVDVWVSTSAGGDPVVASGRSDAGGAVTFWLDPGVYYVWRQKSGWNFTNPASFTVPSP